MKEKWPFKELGELLKIERRLAKPIPGLPYIGLENIESETGRILHIGPNDSIKGTVSLFTQRHILYGKLRPYLNKVANPDFEGACSTEIVTLLPATSCDREWLTFIMRSQWFVNEAQQSTTGSRMPRADIKTLLRLKIPTPPLELQMLMASNLKSVSLLTDKHREIDGLSVDFAVALFHKMFGNPQPESSRWQRKKISELGELFTGATPSTKRSEYWNGSINWVTPAEISDDTFIVNSSQRQITELGYRNCSAKLFPAGTVILSTRAPIGKVAIAGAEMCSNQGIKSINPKPDLIDAVYLYWWLKQSTQLLNSLGGGATFKELSTPSLRAIDVPVPPIALQREFAERIREVQKLKATQDRSGELIDEAFQSLTAELV